ncbi:restriction endonuclease subunit R, partial [Pantoea sp. SIMBA_072]
AKIELDMGTATGGVVTQEVIVYDGDDLQQATKRAVYQDFRIGEINTAKGEEFVELRYPGGEKYLRIGDVHGGVEPLALQREMIRRTIKEHL